MAESKKNYFLSDLHFGYDAPDASSNQREKWVLSWLDSVKDTAGHIYFVGDIFDYWFEYKEVIPKGHFCFLAKLKELVDSGVVITFFTGNHDVWYFGYLEENIGIKLFRESQRFSIANKEFFVAHGDGLGKGDNGYKLIKNIFKSPLCQWLYARIHPNLGIRLMRWFSQKSRESHGDDPFIIDQELTVNFAKEELKKEHFDYFVCGHRHWPVDTKLAGNSRYINLGDWITHRSYAVFNGDDLQLEFYDNKNGKIIH